MSKYTRYQGVVSRQSDSDMDEDHWLKQFEKTLQKAAVQPKSVDSSLFDQINSIMNNKSKYPSVAAAVDDMKERSGLTAYLNKINKISEKEISSPDNISKKASQQDNNSVIDKKIDLTPIVIKKKPQIKNTLENLIRSSKGNNSIPALLGRLKSLHQSDVSDAKDWEDDNLIKLISELNLKAKKDNPSNYENYSNLGSIDSSHDDDIDPSNVNAFEALNPAKI